MAPGFVLTAILEPGWQVLTYEERPELCGLRSSLTFGLCPSGKWESSSLLGVVIAFIE